MRVPLALAPIEQVKPKHRGRALARRKHWGEIMEGAAQAVAHHRRQAPVPLRQGSRSSSMLSSLATLAWVAAAV